MALVRYLARGDHEAATALLRRGLPRVARGRGQFVDGIPHEPRWSVAGVEGARLWWPAADSRHDLGRQLAELDVAVL